MLFCIVVRVFYLSTKVRIIFYIHRVESLILFGIRWFPVFDSNKTSFVNKKAFLQNKMRFCQL
jgi:hypothetical protein